MFTTAVWTPCHPTLHWCYTGLLQQCSPPQYGLPATRLFTDVTLVCSRDVHHRCMDSLPLNSSLMLHWSAPAMFTSAVWTPCHPTLHWCYTSLLQGCSSPLYGLPATRLFTDVTLVCSRDVHHRCIDSQPLNSSLMLHWSAPAMFTTAVWTPCHSTLHWCYTSLLQGCSPLLYGLPATQLFTDVTLVCSSNVHHRCMDSQPLNSSLMLHWSAPAMFTTAVWTPCHSTLHWCYTGLLQQCSPPLYGLPATRLFTDVTLVCSRDVHHRCIDSLPLNSSLMLHWSAPGMFTTAVWTPSHPTLHWCYHYSLKLFSSSWSFTSRFQQLHYFSSRLKLEAC